MADEKPANPFAGLDKALLRATQPRPQEQPQPPAPTADETAPATPAKASRARAQASKPSSKPASSEASDHASALASYHATTAETVEAIRKAVKAPGKEVSFVRLTPQEKGRLADIVYAYKRRGRKTSENEINRVAINFLLEDYEHRGEQSVLARVMAALDA